VIRLNRWVIGTVIAVIIGALFVDGYSYIYRYAIARVGSSGTLPNHAAAGDPADRNPHIGGFDLYIHKGLDIQGGSELTIAICRGFNDPAGTNCRTGLPPSVSLDTAQRDTVTVLAQRVNRLGVSEATVQAQGSDQVLVQLPGVDIATAVRTLGTTSKLYFATAVQGAPSATDPKFVADQQSLYDPKQFSDPNFYPSGYHWKIDNNLQASDVSSADVGLAQNGQFAVNINFNAHGADEWSKITTAAFQQQQGSPQNRVAIFLDNDIITAPDVISPSSSQTQITGGFNQSSAQTLADQISAGALPATIAPIQSSSVSATLGQDTVRKSLIAGLVGFIVIILFMIGYYRFPGLLASLALLCYAGIVLAFYKVVPVTITLAGLAGFVLSVGMAVDANVLIFERTRDELRHGRPVGLAVDAGFRRAFPAIRDSNISTLIACFFLYIFGSSVVRGFALTLAIGVMVSFFSAVTITRALFALILQRNVGRNPRLYTEIHEEYEQRPPRGQFDIVRSRNVWFAGSIAIIVPGILAILFWGFRLGLDFAGGNRIDATLNRPTTQSQVAATVRRVAGDLQPEVQAEDNNRYSIRTLPSAITRVTDIDNALAKDYGIKTVDGKPQIQLETVGPTIASSLVRSAIILVLVSSVAIALYLAYQFRGRGISAWRFSVCTFFKLLHDVFVLAGIWAIIGHFSSIAQVDSLFVTALLTSVAFSIHDTIVVFDRIRENLRVGPRFTFDQTVNLSTAQTMTRSLNTALTVTFVLLALVLFGGDSIRGFVLALLIGIISGTYSSIFNASTLLVAWQSIDEMGPGAAPPGRRAPRRIERRVAV
jgi:SecD/SecF fusion protein